MKKNSFYVWSLLNLGFLSQTALADLLDDPDLAPNSSEASTKDRETPAPTASPSSTPPAPSPASGKTPASKRPGEPSTKDSQATRPSASAKSKSKSQASSRHDRSKEPVHFESKGLKGLREKGMVELMDDVVVTQGEFRLEADRATVHFDEAAHDVVKVVAIGHVKIYNRDEKTGEKLKAFSDQVFFFNRERRVILDGNARLWRGEDSVVRGKKITYEMDTGWIRADRVAGELIPSEKEQK